MLLMIEQVLVVTPEAVLLVLTCVVKPPAAQPFVLNGPVDLPILHSRINKYTIMRYTDRLVYNTKIAPTVRLHRSCSSMSIYVHLNVVFFEDLIYLLELLQRLFQRASHAEQIFQVPQEAEPALRKSVGKLGIPEEPITCWRQDEHLRKLFQFAVLIACYSRAPP